MYQLEHAGLSGNYRYQEHTVREGLPTPETDRDLLQAQYLEFLSTLPYRREIETFTDPRLQPIESFPLDLGDNTAEILFNMRRIDPITYGHGESMATAAVLLAEEMGIDAPPHEIYLGGVLHDVWKVELAHLLQQPALHQLESLGRFQRDPQLGSLSWQPHAGVDVPMLYKDVIFSPEQREEMHIHPQAGAAYLSALGFPQVVVDAPLQHHGFFTFQGEPYPKLPPAAKTIVGANYNVADYLTGGRARRPYKWDVPLEELLERIHRAEQDHDIPRGYTRAVQNLVAKYGEETWMQYTINLPCVLERAREVGQPQRLAA